MKKPPKGWWTWLIVLGVFVGGWEIVGLTTESVPPLTHVVQYAAIRWPELGGGLIFTGLCLLLWHWYLAPLWKQLRDEYGDEE